MPPFISDFQKGINGCKEEGLIGSAMETEIRQFISDLKQCPGLEAIIPGTMPSVNGASNEVLIVTL